jgi:hypothetical protein
VRAAANAGEFVTKPEKLQDVIKENAELSNKSGCRVRVFVQAQGYCTQGRP